MKHKQWECTIWAAGAGMILLSGCETGTTTWNHLTSRAVGYNTQATAWQNGAVANTTQAAPSLKRTYYIDLVISGVRDYLNGKNLDLDMNRIYANPSLYYIFEQDPATWKIGHLLYTLDGSDPLLNPTYVALNSDSGGWEKSKSNVIEFVE